MAINAGYAPAQYVPTFPSKSKMWKENGIVWIPCKAQTNDEMTCVRCRLCIKADKLLIKRMGIAFEVHGCKEEQMRARLER